jgi:hypothetical protein
VARRRRGKYEDVAGFCKSATTGGDRGAPVRAHAGRYVGAEEVEDDGEPFEEKMSGWWRRWRSSSPRGHASSDEMIAHADRASGGTKMPRTSWGDVARLPVALPPTELARVHTDVARPLVAKIEANVHEARTLTALRDAVLPKLLSGELRAHDVKMEQPS